MYVFQSSIIIYLSCCYKSMHGLDLKAANNLLTVFQIVLAIHLTSLFNDFLLFVWESNPFKHLDACVAATCPTLWANDTIWLRQKFALPCMSRRLGQTWRCVPLPVLQGLLVELLRGSAPLGPHVDVSRPGHHRPAFRPLPDPLCCLWLPGRIRHCDGALHPAQRGTSHGTALTWKTFEIGLFLGVIFFFPVYCNWYRQSVIPDQWFSKWEQPGSTRGATHGSHHLSM